jgi:uncharacterized protein (TIGR02301 family)
MTLAALWVAAAATGALAQTAPPDLGPPPPYEDQLLRLSEILGALSYLRPLCDNEDGSVWRDQMHELLVSEDPDAPRRERLVNRFNRGYESFKSVYIACTPAAKLATERYLGEGVKLTADITARYGK